MVIQKTQKLINAQIFVIDASRRLLNGRVVGQLCIFKCHDEEKTHLRKFLFV